MYGNGNTPRDYKLAFMVTNMENQKLKSKISKVLEEWNTYLTIYPDQSRTPLARVLAELRVLVGL